jgi:site-specific DNA-methyltransferase (cytosine-N4-specific)
MYCGKAEDVLCSFPMNLYKGKVQLVFTSPPFPLNRKKKYGNLQGEEYVAWIASFAPLLRKYLTSDGSIVVELGNAWERGNPTMSTLPMRALLAFQEAAELHLCQEFICFNTARLPTPAQWVNIERVRVKDAFTRVWWMSHTPKPKADNRKVLTEYSLSMKTLLKKGTYNHGRRPSEHQIGEASFLTDNGGAIPPNVLVPALENMLPDLHEVLPIANTRSNDPYQVYCRENGIEPHPARMPAELVRFFILFLTDEGDRVLDPFAGSNTTGYSAEFLKRKWLAIEADSKYARVSESRFRRDLG